VQNVGVKVREAFARVTQPNGKQLILLDSANLKRS
jgi:hypothetical protein